MKNSERIRLCVQNRDNPLQNQYKKEYEAIVNPEYEDIYSKIFTFFLITFGILFISSFFMPLFSATFTNVIVILGILNIVIFTIYSLFSICSDKPIKKNKDKIESLNKHYAEKGYIHHDIDSLYSYKGECGEYDDYREIYVCSVDYMPLSYEKQRWCQTAGNCMKCEKLKNVLWPD